MGCEQQLKDDLLWYAVARLVDWMCGGLEKGSLQKAGARAGYDQGEVGPVLGRGGDGGG